MQLCIQTRRGYEARPGCRGTDDRCQSPLICSSTDVLQGRVLVEEWGLLDDRELDSFKGHRSCSTCTPFGYVTLGQCQVLGDVTSDMAC